VISAIPSGSHLAQEVVGSGTVTIALTGVGGPLPVPAGLLLAAQLAATLRQLPDVSGFRLTVDGGNVDLPDVRSDGSVPLTIADRFDPVGRLTTQLFGIAAGLLVRVGDGLGAVARPVTGDFGTRARSVSSIAISRDGVDAAVVTGDSLVHGPVDGPGSRVVVTAKGLLRPQFTAGGALWAITSGGTVYRVVGDIADVVPAPALAAIRVLAFRIAPDGQRIAFVADDKGRRVLGLVRVDSRRAPRVAHDPLARTARWWLDVGWTSPSSLVVLASSAAEQGVRADVDAVHGDRPRRALGGHHAGRESAGRERGAHRGAGRRRHRLAVRRRSAGPSGGGLPAAHPLTSTGRGAATVPRPGRLCHACRGASHLPRREGPARGRRRGRRPTPGPYPGRSRPKWLCRACHDDLVSFRGTATEGGVPELPVVGRRLRGVTRP
jgi:hypothetical protein